MNTDDKSYGGEGIVNKNVCNTTETEWDGRPYAIDMVSAPLSVSIFSYTPYTAEEKAEIDRIRAEEIRKAKEAEERRLAKEAADAIAREAEEARKLAKAAAEEAKERAKIADEMLKRAQEAAAKLQKIMEAQEKNAQKSVNAKKTATAKKTTTKTVTKQNKAVRRKIT